MFPNPVPSSVGLVHYLPMITTVMSVVFGAQLLRRYYLRRPSAHLFWWSTGVLTFGFGTALEITITLFGNSVTLNKIWYIAGALLGAYPLAQGTVFLLLRRRVAIVLTGVTLPLVFMLSALVVLSPVLPEAMEPHRPSGAILRWQWLRLMTPLVNLYAAGFLIGGAILSAWRYATMRGPGDGARSIGNSLIAVGAILPGIGGGMAKAGMVEALYVAELVGLLLIWAGYLTCVQAPNLELPRSDNKAAAKN